ncbi:MAG: EAL domain-containing protein [Parvibaculaceae bacterium]|nr:EAL domain-containing protein [Parvibaculaceae bacterium]
MSFDTNSWLDNLSVKWKILAPFCFLAGVIGLSLIALFFVAFSRYQDSVVEDRAKHLSSSIVYALETMRYHTELERYVAILGAEADVDLLLIVDPATEYVFVSNRVAFRESMARDLSDGALVSEVVQSIEEPSSRGMLMWGANTASYAVAAPSLRLDGARSRELVIFVRLKTKSVTAQSTGMAQQLAIGLLAALALAMLVASKLLYDLVISPLSKLSAIAHARTVDPETMAPFTRRLDEFGELSRSVLQSFAEARENANRFEIQAQSDSLTGLGNRVLFKERLHMALAHAERSGKIVALMILDLDNFKDVNDTLGHDVGDQLLQRVATILKESSRQVDTVVRLGGDEFAIIADDLDRIDGVLVHANRILTALSEPQMINGHEVHPGVSIGITSYPQDARDPDVLLKNADLALYRAKAEGRGNIQLYRHELHLKVIERNAIERDLRTAIAEEQFVLYYQLKVDTETGGIVGAEALIRWRHPERGMIPPDVFIPVAEKNGSICKLTDWVLTEACAEIRRMMDNGLPPVSVAVNVSALDLRRPDFTDQVAATLVRAGVSPKYLEIEVTESTVMHDVDQVIGTLRRLRALGVSISIDDFGTGYSSLAYLKQFPVQTLKIDRSFVADMTEDLNSHAIPQLIVDLARNLGVSVIAEGVETEEQRELLLSMGCGQAQGYLFSPPVPSAAFVEMLEDKVCFPRENKMDESSDSPLPVSVA